MKKKSFRKVKVGGWFTYRSALFVKLNALLVFKVTGKPRKLSVRLGHLSDGDLTMRLYFRDLHLRSLVTPVKVSIKINRRK